MHRNKRKYNLHKIMDLTFAPIQFKTMSIIHCQSLTLSPKLILLYTYAILNSTSNNYHLQFTTLKQKNTAQQVSCVWIGSCFLRKLRPIIHL
jgi:hypothetical protein